MADVMANHGCELDYICNQLKKNQETRQACVGFSLLSFKMGRSNPKLDPTS